MTDEPVTGERNGNAHRHAPDDPRDASKGEKQKGERFAPVREPRQIPVCLSERFTSYAVWQRGEMSMQVLLIVHAEVPNEVDRTPFDQWYDRHMPEALRAFGAVRAWRTWSRTDPSKHTAFYEFSNLETANAAIQSPGNEFDAKWSGRATRTRDVVEVVQRLPD
ncbi:hypothetical protein [Ensifer adhaerens]|uniref:hypothetical protein n=1 Tax=Ensifer adhaerens TaxID=106592 RepID=UPI003F8596B9